MFSIRLYKTIDSDAIKREYFFTYQSTPSLVINTKAQTTIQDARLRMEEALKKYPAIIL